MLKRIATWIAIAATFSACSDSTTGPADGSMLSISFRNGAGSAEAASAAAVVSAGRQAASAASLDLMGSNGTLTLDDVRFLVAELELEPAESEGDCDDLPNEDACEELEAPPQFVQLDLGGASPPVVTRTVKAGVYEELEFEIEDLDLADEEEENGTDLATLFETILAEFPDWPEQASLLVAGSFTPTGGDPVDFRVFFEAEIEVELEFEPPLDLTADPDATVTVVVDPSVWFTRPDGTVLDLSQLQGEVVEFEAEFEDGMTEVEFDQD